MNDVEMETIDDAIEKARDVASIALHRTPYVPDGPNASIIKQKARELRQLDDEAGRQLRKTCDRNDETGALKVFDRIIALRQQIPIHDALIHPCRRLPPEILSKIFVHAVSDPWYSGYVGRRTVCLAQICHSWRCIALATPRLWTTLILTAKTNPPAKYVAALKDELAKTAQAPLHLTLDMNMCGMNPKPSINEIWSDEVWTLLCDQSHRWERVMLAGIPARAYEDLIERTFPALKRLLMFVLRDKGAAVQVPIHAFQSAPKINNFCIDYKSPIHPLVLPSSWTLTVLTIYSDDCALEPTVGAILSCSETLRMLDIAADASCANVLPLTAFPRIEELVLSNDAVALCYSFTSPNLTTLFMESAWTLDDELNAFKALQSLLARSENCPSLRTLGLASSLDPGPSGRELIACLRVLPSLEEIFLSNRDMARELSPSLITLDLLRDMVRQPTVPSSLAFLPNLARLSIRFGNRYNRADPKDLEVDAVLMAILESRMRAMSVDGKDLPLLTHFCAKGGGGKEYCWPPADDGPNSNYSV
ncbi:uncharacterized protein SCHCODRAFT_02569777 [Schizophyllum commune H4-8]|nr:uncharacterized protein SCHCODRAFT_02569777 [Schizophyllum commune H4-8]KAI5896778.1 hypothetical protein SCHCODRAFT_02569777 [Schizophyllum commune H4-8]